MQIIHHALRGEASSSRQILLRTDRLTLAKLRWRGVAEDGREFGFDLVEPLEHGAVFHRAEGSSYQIEQQSEPVLEITGIVQPGDLARLAWSVGNLHQALQVLPDGIRVANDPALRTLLQQLHQPFHEAVRVFTPLRVAGHHHHHHH